MKKIITLIFVALAAGSYAQNMQVQNMVNYLKQKDFAKAKEAADKAAEHESTKSSAKMWKLRGNVYQGIAADSNLKSLDAEAAEKALEAYNNCFKFDKEKIYKDEATNTWIQSAVALTRKAETYKKNKQFENAIKAYDLLDASLVYDNEGYLKKNNLTHENLQYSKFETYQLVGDNASAKTLADKLAEAKFNDVRLYTGMVKTSLEAKDTSAALWYIEKGEVLFPENMSLLTSEIDIYKARKKTDVLKEKLNAAIQVSPENAALHLILANVHKSTNQSDEAEKEYLKALELKPDYDVANYNLAVLYFNNGNEWNEKLNKLAPKDPKEKQYQEKTNDYFKKAVTYFETYYAATQDKDTKQLLRRLTLRLGDMEKAEKYK
ncbi:MAG: tetratricopeptide repeat protein [Bacteroidetes bacterium]|nr:tetratricopeptide repeat protein [Bacteroidota bacterium]